MAQAPLEMALNHAMNEFTAAMRRRATGVPSGVGFADSCAYQYPAELCFEDFYALYERQGLAYGALNRLVEGCWATDPWVNQGDGSDDDEAETTWEANTAALLKRVNAWAALAEADRRRCVGKYAGVLLQVADNQGWDKPLNGRGVLVKLIPAWEGQLNPSTWDENPQSPTYGDPTMWSFNEAQVKAQGDNSPGRSLTVHPSRVFILGDYRDGVPLLRAAYNSFLNIEKTAGGSGESFRKNASRQMHMNFDKEVDLGSIAKLYGVDMAGLQAKFNEAARAVNYGSDQMLVTQGATMSALAATVPDPEKHFNMHASIAGASIPIPIKVWLGNQTGERASTEDTRDWNTTKQGRRIRRLKPDIEAFIQQLIRGRLLDAVPGGELTCMWDDLTEDGFDQKLANASKMAEINQKNAGTGQPVFTVDEIRNVAGFDPAEDMGDLLPELQEPPEDELQPEATE